MRAKIALFLGLIVLVMVALQFSAQTVSHEFCAGAGAAAISEDGKGPISIVWPLPQRALGQSKVILRGQFTNRGECRLRLSRFPFKKYCNSNFQVKSFLRGSSDIKQVQVYMENPTWDQSPEDGPFPTEGDVVVFGNRSILDNSTFEIENCAYLPIARQIVVRSDVQDFLISKGISLGG